MNKLKYLLFVYIAFLFVSCEDFLDEELKAQYDANEYATTESQIRSALFGAYKSVANNYVSGYNASQLPTDLQKRPTWSLQSGLGSYTYTAENNFFYQLWQMHYNAIKDCNYVISSILNLPDGETTYRSELAQALGLRGYVYYNLVRFFGGVPIVEFVVQSPTDPNFYPKRSTLSETLDFIIKDLTYASKYSLTESDQKFKFGQFSRNAAFGFLAKLHLWIASVTERDKVTSYIEEADVHYKLAMENVKHVINSNVYSLTPYYPDVFSCNTEDKAKSEVIFGIVHHDDVQTGGTVGMIFGMAGIQETGGSYGMVATTNFHATYYEPSDSVRRLWNCPRTNTVAVTKEYPNGWLKGHDYWPIYKGSLTISNPLDSNMGYSFGKFRRYPLKNVATYNKNAYGLDEPVLRLSDLFLVYAEAYNELNDDPGVAQPSTTLSFDGLNIISAYDAVNVVRKRARTAAQGIIHQDVVPRVYDMSKQDYCRHTLQIDDLEKGYAITDTSVVRDNNGVTEIITKDLSSLGCVPDWGRGFYGYMIKGQCKAP